jgi:uncharacterized protein (DUF1800 family)
MRSPRVDVPVSVRRRWSTAVAFALLIAMTMPVAAQKRRAVDHPPVDDADVIRFLEQATFGPTPALVARVRAIGFEAWLDEQFAAPVSSYPKLAQQPLRVQDGCPEGSPANCRRDNYSMYPLQVQFFRNALTGSDQLRQRVALALHEILVVSGVEIRQPSMMAPYLDMLARNAFGNYRDLLYDLTLNPAMGRYLDMVNNDAPAEGVAPNENYAREVLQLFSVGVNRLHPDGTPMLDADGKPIPNYGQEEIEGFAHAFTGWTFAPFPGAPMAKHNPPNFLSPMVLFRNAAGRDTNHDKGEKALLEYAGSQATLAAGQSGERDLQDAIDNIFEHPSVGPFLSRQLIQYLVTSNPGPAYVERVSRTFDDDGRGVRGNLRAVVRAILLDPDARGAMKTDPAYGHLREPVLFLTSILRAFNATSDYQLGAAVRGMGQDLFNPPSVFSYYPHEYTVPGTAIQGPEFGILSSSTSEARLNVLDALTSTGIRTREGGTRLDLSPLEALAADADALIDALDAQLLHGTMPEEMRTAVEAAVVAVPASNRLLRAQTALYLIAGSSHYQVQR